MQELAILGGPKAVTADPGDQWRRPVEEEKAAVCELIDRGELSASGTGLPRQFEDEFREYIGCTYVLATDHGHTALASAFFAAGLGAGDEIIHPALGYIGSYAGALPMGARVVFCEPDAHTLLADPEDIQKRITDRTRVINPIHNSGRVCDLDRLLAICERHNLVLVEDAAHAHGSEWDGAKIGNVGHIACFSLQGVTPGGKPVASGEGGVVATNDRELYERCLIYCHLHRTGAVEELTNPLYQDLSPQFLGLKWRAHPLALAIAGVSLRTLPGRLERFAQNRQRLVEAIGDVDGIELAHTYPKAKASELYGGLRFLYDPEVFGGVSNERFCEALQAEGMPMTPHGFREPEHLRAIFTTDKPGLWGQGHPGPADMPLPRYSRGDYPLAESIRSRIMAFPGWVEAADGVIEQCAQAFRKVAEHHAKL